MYNSLILPILDYGCVVLECAPAYIVVCLSIIQNKAVCIIYGAVRTSSIVSMEIECSIMPRSLRHKYLSLRYAIKIYNQPTNPVLEILNLTVTNKKCRNKYSACMFGRLNTPTQVSLRLMEQPVAGVFNNLPPLC